jgi:aspartyl/asparaginyl beta-hydroxylase
MFIRAHEYDYLFEISTNHRAILKEFEHAVSDHPFMSEILEGGAPYIDQNLDGWVKENGFHPDQVGFDVRKGSYSGITIFKEECPVRNIDVSRHFAKTMRLLKGVKRLHYAAFVIMMPNSSLATHAHTRSHMIHHTLLTNLVGGVCEMSCNGDTLALSKAGDSALFDYSLPHGSINKASNTRINFIVDFKPA